MQIILTTRCEFPLGYEKCCVSKGYSNLFTFSGLKQTLPGFCVTRFTSAFGKFLSRFLGTCATWLRQSVYSKTLSAPHNGELTGVDPGRPQNLQRRKVEVTS